MSAKNKGETLSEEEIDKLVVAQVDDETAWEEAISVHLVIPTMVSLPPEMATRAAFFAQLHKKSNVEDWLRTIIQERIDFEEAAFAGLKQILLS